MRTLPLSGVFYLAVAGCLATVGAGAYAVSNALHAQRAAPSTTPARFLGRPIQPGVPLGAPGPAAGRAAAPAATTTRGRPGLAPVRVSTTALPDSSTVSEPSIALDSKGNIYVTAPTGLGHSPSLSTSPLWKSSDGGATWQGPISTETGAQTASGVGGGDSDIVIDSNDDIFITSLWLGDTSMSVSSDGGSTFTALPVGHLTPMDDRPWLAWDPTSDSLWMDYDGFESLRVARTVLNSTVDGAGAGRQPATGLVFSQNVPAEPNETSRNCTFCPPGTIAVDPSGNVWVAYVAKDGRVAVAESQAGQATTPVGVVWHATEVSDSGSAATNDSNNFQVLRSDGQGNLYLVWSQKSSNGGPSQVFLSWLQAGGSSWSAPLQVSTTASALFGTLAVVAPGTVDVAYYGSNYAGDSNAAPAGTQWSVYLAQVQNLSGSASTLTADLMPAFHSGSISTQGATCTSNCPDRSLGDFFSIAVDRSGMADIITTAGDASSRRLAFVHQTGAIQNAGALPPAAALMPPYPNVAPSFPPYQPQPAGYPPYAGSSGSGVSSQPLSGGSSSYAAVGGAQQAQAGRSTRRYPDGVPLDAVAPPAGGGPLPGPPLWVYGLLGGGGILGRLVLRRLLR
jgi:hypothetical protein